MADPGIGTAASLTKLFEYFRPSKSPYLLAISVTSFVVILYSSHYDSSYFGESFAILIPIIFFVLFLYRLILTSKLEPIDDNNVEELQKDIEDQFKLARATAVSTAIWLIYQINFTSSIENFILYWVTYICILVYLIYFSIVMYRKHNKFEDNSNINIFQAGFSTSMLLITFSSIGASIPAKDGNLLYHCHYQRGYEYQYFRDSELDNNLIHVGLVQKVGQFDESIYFYTKRIVQSETDDETYEEDIEHNSTEPKNLIKRIDVKKYMGNGELVVSSCEENLDAENELIAEKMVENELVSNKIDLRFVEIKKESTRVSKWIDFKAVLYIFYLLIWLWGMWFWVRILLVKRTDLSKISRDVQL